MGLNKEIKNKKVKIAFSAALLSLLVVGALFLKQAIHRSGFFHIKEVRFIETNSSNLSLLINQKMLLEKVAIKSDWTVFSTDLLGIEERLSSIPWIESMQVQRKIPNSVEVRYSLYEAAGYATISGKLWLVSSDGVALGLVPNPLQFDFPVFSIVNDSNERSTSFVNASSDFSGHVQWLRRLSAYKIDEIRFKSENHFEILLNIGSRKLLLKVPASHSETENEQSVNRLSRVVQYIVKHNIFVSLIDLRAGKKVVVNIGKNP